MKAMIYAAAVAMMFGAGAAAAGEYDAKLQELAGGKLRAVVSNPSIISAIKAQNKAHAGLSEADIIALDKKWRAEVGAEARPTIDKVMNAPASAALVEARDAAEGLYTEIFVMDNRGLNVAASDVTSDYWQGDEAKWKKTFLAGAEAVHLSDVELDESAQTYQAQVSLTIVDPDGGAPIGAVTFGVNVEGLE